LKVSVVLPAYNERDNIALAVEGIFQALAGETLELEVIFVDDGSSDGTWEAVRRAAQDPRVRGVRLSRHFGKEGAVLAGLQAAEGDCCVTMDCDLQHPPRYIPEMLRLWREGYQVIEGVKADRGREGLFRRACARGFYGLISRASGLELEEVSDFKLLDRKAVDAILAMPERNTFYRALSGWVGFRTARVPFVVEERREGRSKWGLWSLIRYAVRSVTSFSTAPMQIVTVLGGVVVLFSVVLGVQTLVKKAMGLSLEGFTTVIVVQLFIGGVIMLSLGLIGYYVARIYEEVKRRPRYIVAEACGKEEK